MEIPLFVVHFLKLRFTFLALGLEVAAPSAGGTVGRKQGVNRAREGLRWLWAMMSRGDGFSRFVALPIGGRRLDNFLPGGRQPLEVCKAAPI